MLIETVFKRIFLCFVFIYFVRTSMYGSSLSSLLFFFLFCNIWLIACMFSFDMLFYAVKMD